LAERRGGFGKSAIALSVFKRLCSQGRLGVSFFFSRRSKDKSDIMCIFPTIAYQLVCQHPEFRAALLYPLKLDPDVVYMTLMSQAKELLITPLQFCGISAVVVIDALDECTDTDSILNFLYVLSQKIQMLLELKFSSQVNQRF
jgi:hypothetical protein